VTTIGVLTSDATLPQAVQDSMANVAASLVTFSSIDQLQHQQIDLLLCDERQLDHTSFYDLAIFCPRIICVFPRDQRREYRMGPYPKVILPVWFFIVPCDPEEFAMLINGVFKHSTEYLIRRWAECRTLEDE
jgi:hypothetical protein